MLLSACRLFITAIVDSNGTLDPNLVNQITKHLPKQLNLFTVVALVIAVCGSTYGAISSLRSVWQSDLASIKGSAPTRLRKIEKGRTPEAYETAQDAKKKIKDWYKIWTISIAIPIIQFLFAAFGITLYVCIACWNNPLAAPHCWTFFKIVLIIMTGINLLCLFFACRAHGKIIDANKILNTCVDVKGETDRWHDGKNSQEGDDRVQDKKRGEQPPTSPGLSEKTQDLSKGKYS